MKDNYDSDNSSKHKFNKESLIQAVEYVNDLKLVKKYAKSKQKPDLKDIKSNSGDSLLHLAVSYKMIKFLIYQNCDVNAINSDKKTPLHYNTHDTQYLKLLLKKGADVNHKSHDGKTPIFSASNREVAELLIAHGADVGVLDDQKSSVLSCVAKNTNIPINVEDYCKLLEFLIEQGLNINSQDLNGKTPLHYIKNSKEAAEILCQNGADLNIKDTAGNTSMHYVQNPEVAAVLLKHGVNSNIKNKFNETPLDSAIKNYNVEMIKFLAKEGVKFSINTINALESDKLNVKYSNTQIQDLFKDNALVARGTDNLDEIQITRQNHRIGNEQNVEHGGFRSRSTTLLAKDENIELFRDLNGFLYDLDKIQVRLFRNFDMINIYADADHSDFYFPFSHSVDEKKLDDELGNHLTDDKTRLNQALKMVITNESFVKQFKDYANNFKEIKPYNELFANLHPESLVAIYTQHIDEKNKIDVLIRKYYISEVYGVDLPIVFFKEGKVTTWNPSLLEIEDLFTNNKDEAIKAGFIFDPKSSNSIIMLNKNEISLHEVKNFFNTHVGTEKTEKLIKNLLDIVNDRLINDALAPIEKLDDFIIHKEDIKNFISNLDKEISFKDPNHKMNYSKNLDNLTQNALNAMQSNRPKKEEYKELSEYKSIMEILCKVSTSVQVIQQAKIDMIGSQHDVDFFLESIW